MKELILEQMDYADFSNPIDISDKILADIRKQSPLHQIPIPFPIHEVAKLLGIIEIKSLENSVGFEGMLLKKEYEGYIFFNGQSHLVRQRFTIAHELGHWMIPWHTMDGRVSFKCDSNTTTDTMQAVSKISNIPKIEIEANRFAASLLLPKNEFKTAIKREPCLKRLRQLAFDYKVSFQAFCFRFKELSDYDCAIIQHKDFIITNIFSTKNFPKLSVSFQVGSPISPRSISATTHTNTNLEPEQAKNWLYSDIPKYAELFEQLLIQEEGYRTTLLYLDTRNCLDEDELLYDELSQWNPKFRR